MVAWETGAVKRSVTVVGSATVSVEPDVARFGCGVRSQAASAQDALRRANEATQAIVAALDGRGVGPADRRTSGPYLHRDDQGYAASNDVQVTVRDVATLGPVIDAVAAVAGPDLTLHGVTFAVADPSAHLSAARGAAMASARAIAEELAAAGGVAVGDVVTIEEVGGAPGPRPMMRAAMASAPVEPGEQQLQLDVRVTYRLVDAG